MLDSVQGFGFGFGVLGSFQRFGLGFRVWGWAFLQFKVSFNSGFLKNVPKRGVSCKGFYAGVP